MLNRIIAFSIRNKLIIGLFVVALAAFGAYEITRLPIDAVPDITNNQVQVITVSPALGAPDIERLITFPVEQANSNIPGLKEIRSFSRFGLSVVTIVFSDETDIYWARQQVSERLQGLQDEIPPGSGQPQLGPVTTGLGEVYQYVVRPLPGYESRYTPMELRTIQDWVIRRQLLGVKGVADVASFGGELKQYEVAVDPARLKANDVSIGEVFAALQRNNQNTGGAYIEKGPTALFIRSEGLVGTYDDIRSIVVKNLRDGTPLLIRDVAEVGPGHAIRYGAMTFNGRLADSSGIGGRGERGRTGFSGLQEVSGAVVMMLKGANSNEVIRNIRERVAQISKTLPEGVVIDAFLDRSKMVDHAIGTVKRNLVEGALIVIFVLVIFLGNWRSGLLVASIIPLSFLFAVIMMNMFGVSGNLMSLGALDFGLIVDGAVIIVEAVMHRFRPALALRGAGSVLTHAEMDAAVQESAGRMMNSAVFGQIIILIVYLPILSLQGIEGKMFRPMAETVAFALLGAFLLSITYIPMMSSLVLSRKIALRPSLSDRVMQRLEGSFRKTLHKVVHRPAPVIGVVLILFALAVWILSGLGGEFIPSLEEGDFAVETRVLTGSNLHTSQEAISQASDILLGQFPEVEKVAGKTGSSEIPTDPMPVDASDMIVVLKDKSEWRSAKTFPELEAKMREALEAVPGVTFGFQFPVQMRFNELMTGARQDLVCKIFGDNLDTLAHYAAQLGGMMNSVRGTSGLYVEAVTGMPQIVIRYDRPAIAQYGLTIGDINRVVNTAFAGEKSGTVYEGEKRFDLVVRLGRDQRKGITDVQDLLIPTPAGTQIPLRLVAQVDVEDGPNQIQREDAHRRIAVGCNIRGRDVQSVVKELQEKAESGLRLPPGYYIRYGGAFENLVAAKKRLSVAVPISLLLIFLLLYFAFRSMRQGLLIYTAIPLSATGGIFALALRGMPFSISAGVGFIALFGVAVLNGIVLLSEYNKRKKAAASPSKESEGPMAGEGGKGLSSLEEIVLDGTASRLRPVLMTAFVASLGFLPMALSNGAGAEVQRPLATVVIGGLLIATFLTLFVLPVLYILTEKKNYMRNFNKQVVMLFLVMSVWGVKGMAQGQPISLAAAVDSAVRNNGALRSGRLGVRAMEQMKRAGYDIAQTTASFEYGQINSAYADNKFMISQAMRFPTVYARQKTLYTEEWERGLAGLAVQEKELRRQVTQLYYEMAWLVQKRRLLEHSDSLLRAFRQRAEERMKRGEANVLEKVTAETQEGQVALQLGQLGQDLIMLQERFRWLLHAEAWYLPMEEELRLPVPALTALTDTLSLAGHPLMEDLARQQKVSEARWRLEKSRLAPDLFAGYNNMTMRGDGADGKTYTSSNRFSSVQVGLGIPLFSGAQRAVINASRTNVRVAENNYSEGIRVLESRYREAVIGLKKAMEAVRYYESSALAGADTIDKTASRQLAEGEINYLDWVLLENNAVAIRSAYLDALKAMNLGIIEVNYYVPAK